MNSQLSPPQSKAPLSDLFHRSIEVDAITHIKSALREDLGDTGDITSQFCLESTLPGKAVIISKETGVVAGLIVAQLTFRELDAGLHAVILKNDGDRVVAGEAVLEAGGRAASILTAERTALNFLQRLSGIASLTARFVENVAGTAARILDTRKTTPGLRSLEKYAVRAGGGENHRFGLFDMVLIKENHIAAAGGITRAISNVRSGLRHRVLPAPAVKIEVEVRNLDELKEALELCPDRVLLDNMDLRQIQQAVRLVAGRLPLEVSGGVTLDNVRQIAQCGVDFISVGALTHSAPALDFSLLFDHDQTN